MKYRVGDLVEHTNSHRRGHIVDLKECSDGTVDMQVLVTASVMSYATGHSWWNSMHVEKVK